MSRIQRITAIHEYVIFIGALVPTFLLVGAAAISFSQPIHATVHDGPLPIQAAVLCESCLAAAAQ